MQEEIIKKESAKFDMLLLDWPALQETCLYKESLVDKLLNLYLQQLPGWIKEIRESVEQNNAELIRRICHTVRGATAAIHAPACVTVLKRLNTLAREGDLAESPNVMAEVILTLEHTGLVIKRLLEVSK